MIEAWHRSFNTRNMASHPNIAHLITKIQQEEEIDRLNLVRAKAGNFRLADTNLLKEEKLYILCTERKYFSIEIFLEIVADLYKWEFLEEEPQE
ncbi:hypothetical protein ENBRE01_2066 [Enteropsectra breve]|nr:hypothetical protein ENBRE01_2066 [Enteropsectra breve]